MLEDGSLNIYWTIQLIVLIEEESDSKGYHHGTNEFSFERLALCHTETAVHHKDASHQIGDIEEHRLQADGGCFGKVACEKGQRVAILVESHPEEDDNGKDKAETDDALLGLGGRKFLHVLRLLSLFFLALIGENMLVRSGKGIVNQDADNQRKASHSKGIVVGISLRNALRLLCPFHNHNGSGWGKHGADIDGHIEEREARVALVGKLWCIIQTAYHHLQVAFEETRTEGDENQRKAHGSSSQHRVAERQREDEITNKHNVNASGHHTAEAKLVSGNTTHDGQEVHHHEECGIDGTGYAGCVTEIGLQIQQEHG